MAKQYSQVQKSIDSVHLSGLDDSSREASQLNHPAPTLLNRTVIPFNETSNGTPGTAGKVSSLGDKLSLPKAFAGMPTLEPAFGPATPNTGRQTIEAPPISDQQNQAASYGSNDGPTKGQENSVQGMTNQGAEKQCMDSISFRELKMEMKLLETEQRCDKVTASKDAEIQVLKCQVGNYEERTSNLEKTNEEDRVEYEAKINHLRKELETEHEKEKLELQLKISNMETQKERMQHQLASSEERVAKLGAELDLVKEERDKAKASSVTEVARRIFWMFSQGD